MDPKETVGDISDGVITVRLLGMSPGDACAQEVPAYRFAILSAGLQVGAINLRVGMNETIARFRGQIGFTIDPEHRGRGYATRACRLVVPVAARHGFRELWVTCDPDNVASRRTIESIGGRFIDVVEVPVGTRFYEEGSRHKCRYLVPVVPDDEGDGR